MTTPPVDEQLFSYLRERQGSDDTGLEASISAPTRRTVYRWHQRLGDQLLVIPNIAVESLGLRHAHVFITNPDASWLSFPYAVEAAWLTPDLARIVLYLHCLVPASTDLNAVITGRKREGQEVETIGSRSGWQQLLSDEEDIILPVISTTALPDMRRRSPFIVPTAVELWTFPNTLPVAWSRIKDHLGEDVTNYLHSSRTRRRGKEYLTHALETLRDEGLFCQHLIRFHPLLAESIEVFLHVQLNRDDLAVLLEGLRHCLHGVETYPTANGYWCQLLGPRQLQDAIMHLPVDIRVRISRVYFHAKQPAPTVRFQYETLYDPVTCSWK
jgi:hypothetical protein